MSFLKTIKSHVHKRANNMITPHKNRLTTHVNSLPCLTKKCKDKVKREKELEIKKKHQEIYDKSVKYSEDRYKEITSEVSKMLTKIGFKVSFI